MDSRGSGRLEWVRVAIGELAAVEPELLVYAWEAIVSGGPDAGARLEVEWHPVKQVCAACGAAAEREPGSWLRLCPSCGQPVHIEGGDELDVLQLSYLADGESEEETA